MQPPHISVCICTFKRAALLANLLSRLEPQETGNFFTYSVAITDNDAARSAEQVVAKWSSKSGLALTYCVEPLQNIALARNRAVGAAEGDFIAFIDDDEFPDDKWLLNLYRALVAHKADGVLGPVLPHFEEEPPAWVKSGRFFERPNHKTGYVINWPEGRTGNVLFRKSILGDCDVPFRSEFDTAVPPNDR